MDASQEVVVKEPSCGTENFIIITQDEADMRGEDFDELIFGRTLAKDLLDTKGNLLVTKNTLIDKPLLRLIMDSGVDMVAVRSPLTCTTVSGVCQKCFGMDLSTREEAEL